MDPISQQADDDTLTQVPPEEGDVYSAMLGGKYDPQAVAGQLNQQGLLGLLLQSSGDKAIAPVGQTLSEETGQQLQGLSRTRQAMAQLGAEQAYRQAELGAQTSYRQADLGLRQQQMDQENALRQEQLRLTQQNEELNRNLQSQLHGTNPQSVSDYAAAARKGDLPPITGWAASTPFGQAVDAALSQPGPDGKPFDPSLYGARQRVLEQLQKDDQARALTALQQHLGVLQLAAYGKTGNSPQILNQAIQMLQRQTGNAGITSYDTAANVVADELSRFLLPRGGTEQDRQKFIQTLAPKLTASQFPANVGTYRNLIGGQIEAKRRQYGMASPDILNQYLPEESANEGRVYSSPSTGRRFLSIGGKMIEIPSGQAAPASVPENAATASPLGLTKQALSSGW